MIILDTNVVSEVMKKRPSGAVLTFLDRHPEESFYISTITVAEIWGGGAKKRDPEQREDLTARAEAMFEMFRGRVLSFDKMSAQVFGKVVGPAKLRGETIHFQDGAIGSIAKLRDAVVATRDVRPFEQAGLEVINPWETDE